MKKQIEQIKVLLAPALRVLREEIMPRIKARIKPFLNEETRKKRQLNLGQHSKTIFMSKRMMIPR